MKQIRLNKDFYNAIYRDTLDKILTVNYLSEELVEYNIFLNEVVEKINPFLLDHLIQRIKFCFYGEREDQDFYIKKVDIEGKKFSIVYNTVTQQVRERNNQVKEYIEEAFKENMKGMESAILEGHYKENVFLLDSIEIDKRYTVEVEEESLLKLEILSKEEYRSVKNLNPQASKLKYLEDSNIPEDGVMITLFKNNKIIGATLLSPSREHKDAYASHALSIIDTEQGKGYSSLLVEARFEYLKSLNKAFQASLYSEMGFETLRKKNYYLSQKYGIKLYENGLLSPVQNITQFLFSMQKDLEKKVKRNLEQDGKKVIYINQYINYEEIKEMIDRFLQLDIHEERTEEDYRLLLKEYEEIFDSFERDRFLKYIEKTQ